jgi:hypothetical protein
MHARNLRKVVLLVKYKRLAQGLIREFNSQPGTESKD